MTGEKHQETQKESKNKDALQNYYNKLASCTCCDRHKHNKPSKIEDGWVETEWHNTQIGDPGMYCTCDCRHLMRFIARSYNPNQEYCYPVQQS